MAGRGGEPRAGLSGGTVSVKLRPRGTFLDGSGGRFRGPQMGAPARAMPLASQRDVYRSPVRSSVKIERTDVHG